MRAVLAKGASFRFRARGWSMVPFIRDGDVITIAPLRGMPAVGQVVAFTRPGSGDPVVHRAIARHGAALLIQGDGVPGSADGIIPRESLLGRVTRVERGGKRVWIGLGPERYPIAWLSRARLLIPLRRLLPSWVKSLLRR